MCFLIINTEILYKQTLWADYVCEDVERFHSDDGDDNTQNIENNSQNNDDNIWKQQQCTTITTVKNYWSWEW